MKTTIKIMVLALGLMLVSCEKPSLEKYNEWQERLKYQTEHYASLYKNKVISYSEYQKSVDNYTKEYEDCIADALNKK